MYCLQSVQPLTFICLSSDKANSSSECSLQDDDALRSVSIRKNEKGLEKCKSENSDTSR